MKPNNARTLQDINKTLNCRFVIGIDPPQGWAVYDRVERRLVEVVTTKGVYDTMARLTAFSERNPVVYCEDTSLNKPVWHREGTSTAAMLKIAANVGANKERASHIMQHARDLGLTVIPVRPSKKTRTKLTPQQFARITGWTKRSSSHGRDAGMLCLGK